MEFWNISNSLILLFINIYLLDELSNDNNKVNSQLWNKLLGTNYTITIIFIVYIIYIFSDENKNIQREHMNMK